MSNFKIDFIGIGTEKGATYWISDCLREHPEVCFSKKKEIVFFNEFDQHYLKYENLRYSWGIKWYERHFSHCSVKSIKGEFTPTYLYSKKTAQRIKKHFPNAKLIICLRDPVKRAYSQYLHDKSIGIIKDLKFSQALQKHDNYIEKGKYYKYLRYYYDLFPRKNIHVVLIDDLKNNSLKYIQKLYKFLNINSTYIPRNLKKRPNAASSAKFQFLNYFLLQAEYFLIKNKLNFFLRILENSGARRALFLFSYYMNRKPLDRYPQIDKQSEKKLRKLFQNDIKNLEKLIGRSLSRWS